MSQLLDDVGKVMKSTEELINLLQNLNIEEFKKDASFREIKIEEYLDHLLTQHGLTAKDVIFKLNMERSYTYQILKGRRNPTRKFLIRIALLCQLSLEETQHLLAVGNRPALYPRNRFDAMVIYGIQHNLTEEEINELSTELGEDTLS